MTNVDLVAPNADLVKTLAMWLTLIVLIVVAGLTIMGSIAFWNTETGGAKTFSLLLQRAAALQMLTILVIVLAATALRVLDLIPADALVALLSGIAGYVLGGATKVKQGEEEEKSKA